MQNDTVVSISVEMTIYYPKQNRLYSNMQANYTLIVYLRYNETWKLDKADTILSECNIKCNISFTIIYETK